MGFFPKHIELKWSYSDIILDEAIYVLEHNIGRMNRFDSDMQALVIET